MQRTFTLLTPLHWQFRTHICTVAESHHCTNLLNGNVAALRSQAKHVNQAGTPRKCSTLIAVPDTSANTLQHVLVVSLPVIPACPAFLAGVNRPASQPLREHPPLPPAIQPAAPCLSLPFLPLTRNVLAPH
eukprot:364983-Chlamydomonas_euryale.AAC.3